MSNLGLWIGFSTLAVLGLAILYKVQVAIVNQHTLMRALHQVLQVQAPVMGILYAMGLVGDPPPPEPKGPKLTVVKEDP